jgi:serine/threonine-protein kinase HipA
LGGNVKPGGIQVELKQALGRKYLEIERFDRFTKSDTSNMTTSEHNGNLWLSIPKQVIRRHQEDFCQVLGYLAKRKYQADGGPKIRDLHNAILEHSSQKATDSYLFIELLMFNYLVGNTDSHAKNFSLLYRNDSDRIILAPAYDIVSVELYPEKLVSHEIAMTINGKGRYDKITKKDWLALYEQLGLNPTITMREMKHNFANIVKTAENLRDELNANDLTKSEIYDDIIAIIKKRFDTLFGE